MIDVYIPTYRENENLLKSVESVKGLNIVVVDNNSGNEYDEILNKVKNKCTIIRNSNNLGRVGNWKACIEHFQKSDAEWMKWLFTGDTLFEDAKEKMEKAVLQYPEAKMIIFSYDIESGNNISECNMFEQSKLIYPKESLINVISKGNWCGVPIACLIHKDAIKKFYSFGEIPWVADFQFALNIVSKFPVAYVNEKIGTFKTDSRKFFTSYEKQVWAMVEDYVIRKQSIERYMELNKSATAYNQLEVKLKDNFFQQVERFMIKSDNSEIIQKEIDLKLKVINEKFSKHKNIKCVIWGAGNGGKIVKDSLDVSEMNYNVIAYIDLYKEGQFNGINIIKPIELENLEFDYIFIATTPGKKYAQEFLENIKLKIVNDFISLI